MIEILILIFGVLIGSFLSMCIYRIPRADSFYQEENPPEPVGFNEPKRSICTKCGKQLFWWHNIPLLSWIILGGKCWFCKAKISARYPAVEALTSLTAYTTYIIYGFTPTALLVFVFCSALIVISFIDYDFYIIPDVISLPATAIGVIIAIINQFTGFFTYPVVPDLFSSALGILAGAGFLYLISEVYLKLRKIEGLGLGDVKLLAMTGALFGPQCALYTIFVGSVFGSVLGIALVLIKGRSFSQHLPFGPYLAVATILYLFVGLDLVYYVTGVF